MPGPVIGVDEEYWYILADDDFHKVSYPFVGRRMGPPWTQEAREEEKDRCCCVETEVALR
jgi:hypothetical protein